MDFNRYLAAILARCGGFLPDDLYLKMRYRLIMGRPLRLDNPQTFNEKLISAIVIRK